MRDPQSLREAALLLPFLGAFLLASPLLSVFDREVTLAGVPVLHVYIFACWLALVLAGFWLTRRLAATGEGADGEDGTGDPGDPRSREE